MAAKLSAAEITALDALTSLEAQTVFVLAKLEIAEGTYNSTSTTGQFNNVSISPNFDANRLNMSASIPLSVDAVGGTLVNGVVPYLA